MCMAADAYLAVTHVQVAWLAAHLHGSKCRGKTPSHGGQLAPVGH